MSQYAAPGRDGTYVNDPGRENPTYKETESLLMLNELDNEKEDPDNPFRPPPDEDRYRDDPDGLYQQKDPPPESGYDDDSDDDLMFDEDREAIGKTDSRDEDASDAGDRTEFRDEDEEPEEGRREWKYSTANIKQTGIWVKYCCILLFFLLCFAIFTAISILFEKLFFSDKDDDVNQDWANRPDNDTFPSHKELIDKVCSLGTFELDRGMRCREYCEPQYSACCDVFPQYETYNYTRVHEALNATEPPVFMLDDDDFMHLNECEFGNHLRGCTAYGKCAALKKLIDPAPQTLPILCSEEQLAKDPGSCEAACRKVQCCFNEDGLSCLTENMDVCMDYAPCQNLRERNDPSHLLPAAPDDLDRLCWWKLPQCAEACERARPCMDSNSRFLQENFLSCLTYGGCEDNTDVNITLPPMYSFVPQAPAELFYACGDEEPENDEILELVEPGSCPEYCEQVACCYQSHPADNCFHKDPLGCWAWHQHCQTESAAIQSWFIGDYFLPTPP